MLKVMKAMGYFEDQYNVIDALAEEDGLCSLGAMTSYTWINDPKRLLFVLARYKVAASILSGEEDVLEIGCGDGFPARIVAQAVKELTLCDIDQKFVDQAKLQSRPPYEYAAMKHDFMAAPTPKRYSSCYLLDVLEHIDPKDQHLFLSNIGKSVKAGGKIIIGMPSLESQLYASEESKRGHINCQSKSDLRHTLQEHFSSVSMFSMNDETLHTGFGPMSHYVLALCTN